MPKLWGEELKIARDIRDSLKDIATSLKDYIELERQKLEILNISK